MTPEGGGGGAHYRRDSLRRAKGGKWGGGGLVPLIGSSGGHTKEFASISNIPTNSKLY
jgi:hypothetical protein